MLNNIGLPGLLLIAVVVLVLFGRGKVSSLMGEVGKGITAFKKGVSEETAEINKTGEAARDVTPAAAPVAEATPVAPAAAPVIPAAAPVAPAAPVADKDKA